ncbi:hypothetical protein BIW11_02683 [Tropilaelaps mercedesae]|uniref:Uncharacterized protein n=1 Tax=Tropilaelaps mercedesae TaxID=418985 RepID=A0A1V9XZ26_9ACAR|nr:hypothetical protein BIW11_02683 [Tropilaelaps mercedesae]
MQNLAIGHNLNNAVIYRLLALILIESTKEAIQKAKSRSRKPIDICLCDTSVSF